MSYPEVGNVLVFPAYSAESEQAVQEIQWSQSFRTKTARYYIVKAKNQSKGNVDVLLYVQDRFYKDESSSDFVGKIPGARKEGSTFKLFQSISYLSNNDSDVFIVTINDRFQYGQKNKNGDGRWVALHDKDNKPYQVGPTLKPCLKRILIVI